jgi:elongator complex protein 3
MRASGADYDARRQTCDRVAQLGETGHSTDKVELVVMGGTFPATPEDQRRAFVKGALDALNGFTSPTLDAAIDANETGAHRCVALTMETRPDLCDYEGVDKLLAMGTTRVEIGVQTTEDRPLEMVARGHGLAESVAATRNLKDAGLKVGYHLMLGLPGMSLEDDLRALARTIDDEDLRPDLLKLYPTLVMPGTPLHEQWEEGAYEPLEEGGAIEVLSGFKPLLPTWVRVSRVERDIPSNLIAAGVRASNLRQLVAERMEGNGHRCRCIRCREVGRRGVHRLDAGDGAVVAMDPSALELRDVRYGASGGEEAFLALELPDADAIVAYGRVRRPSDGAWRRELDGAALLREIRVLGMALPLGEEPSDSAGSLDWQHRGLGVELLRRAEGVAMDWGMKRLAVTAGMGARGYFRARGYDLVGPYMVRALG